MREQSDKKNLMLDDGTQLTGLNRWIPTIIVFCVVAGFFTLSWYAYHAGMQSVKEEDLLIVEADTGPLKEKPSDPGGMQFPNQDKTIFETFGNTESKPQRVERILPTPEEPMSKDAEDTEGTKTWVNKNISGALSANTDSDGTRTEVLISSATPQPMKHRVGSGVIEADKKAQEAEGYVAKKEAKTKSFVEQKLKEREAQEAKEKAAKEKAAKEKAAKEKQQLEAANAKKREEEIRRQEKASIQAAKERAAKQKAAMSNAQVQPSATSGGSQMVQLGAFRSKDEATRAWNAMHIKHKILSDKRPTIVRADLGEKGVYHRLRVGNLSDAKTLCTVLKSSGQACLPISAK